MVIKIHDLEFFSEQTQFNHFHLNTERRNQIY